MSRCRGESRTQGVHISQANVQLCKDVIETCSAGRFAISSIRRISERLRRHQSSRRRPIAVFRRCLEEIRHAEHTGEGVLTINKPSAESGVIANLIGRPPFLRFRFSFGMSPLSWHRLNNLIAPLFQLPEKRRHCKRSPLLDVMKEDYVLVAAFEAVDGDGDNLQGKCASVIRRKVDAPNHQAFRQSNVVNGPIIFEIGKPEKWRDGFGLPCSAGHRRDPVCDLLFDRLAR